MADAAHRLDVVGMVVSNQHIMNGTQAKAKVPEMLLECPNPYSYVNYQSILFGKQKVAVAAASAPYGYEFQHLFCLFFAKVHKIILKSEFLFLFFHTFVLY